MEYLLKSSAIILLFYSFYKLFLRNETHFNLTRWFFLIGIVVSIALPLIIIPIYVTIAPNLITEAVAINHSVTELNTDSSFKIGFYDILSIIYIAATLVLLIRFLVQLFSLFILLLKYKWIKKDTYYLIDIDEDISPFSFFNLIVFNSNQFTKDELDQIITHEIIHVKQLHSIDNIILQLLTIALWFNPFIWLYKKEAQQNLEFITDNNTQQQINCKKSYQQLLLKTSSPNYQMALINNFYNSLLKKRILMLHKKRSSNRSKWKFALITPLLIAFLLTFNTKTIAQNSDDENEFIEIKSEVLELLISKKTSKQGLKKLADEFSQHGLKVNFSDIKRNGNDEIISIKIDAKATNGKASAAYAANNDSPIKPISISYDKENNNLSIGSSHGSRHEYHFSNSNGTKIIKRKGKKGTTEDIHIEVHSDDDSDSHTKVWVSKDGKTKKMSKRKEVIIEVDDDGNETKKEIIKIKGGKGANEFVFIEDNDDPNAKITYIVNGKKMSKEEFKKMDKKDIKTIEIKKEVKKEKKN